MNRHLSRLGLVLMLLTLIFGGAAMPGRRHVAAQEGQFSAAANVLKQSGKVGYWMFPEPPGFPPVTCTYYPNGKTPNGIPINHIWASPPNIYSVPGLPGQPLEVIYRFNQRWPDGSLHAKLEQHSYGPAGYNAPTPVPTANFYTYDRGSTFSLTVEIIWFFGSEEVGRVELLYTQYQSNVNGSPGLPVTNACKPINAAKASLGTLEGTVGAAVPFTLNFFPSDPNVGIYFDGKKIGELATDQWGDAKGSFVVPAAPMGKHTVNFDRYGRSASATFTIKPRIKLIPSTVGRGQTVNVSLRGYAKYETVNIRWKKGTSWVQVGQVKTSGTGSANINIKVPTFAPNGTASVRGDSLNATGGHAQTSLVTVSGGTPLTTSAVKPPTPTPTATKTPTTAPTAPAMVTSVPQTPEATPEQVIEATPEATATPVVETPAPETRVVETPVPEETVTAEPTAAAPAESTVAPEASPAPSNP